jgi:hypothetical protein
VAEPLPEVEPPPALVPLLALSLDELELEDDGEDGAGVAGVVVLRLELIEPDGELGELGELDDVLPLPDVARSAPRSQAAIRLAPSARETATARDWNFMCNLLELGCTPLRSKLRTATGRPQQTALACKNCLAARSAARLGAGAVAALLEVLLLRVVLGIHLALCRRDALLLGRR